LCLHLGFLLALIHSKWSVLSAILGSCGTGETSKQSLTAFIGLTFTGSWIWWAARSLDCFCWILK
jgi:hypothetical protein